MSIEKNEVAKFVPPHDHLTAFANARIEIQESGSVMTYAKRFLYQNLLMIVGDDDDDANVAQQSVNRL